MTTTFLFFPQPLNIVSLITSSSPSSSSSSERAHHEEGEQENTPKLFLYGWASTNSIVVAGALRAVTFEQANQKLDAVSDQSRQQREYKVLGHACACQDTSSSSQDKGKGKERARDQDSILPSVHVSLLTGIPTLCSSLSSDNDNPTTLIHYTPPSPSQLQFLSLTPLQLDLTTFTSPVIIDKRDRKRPLAKKKTNVPVDERVQLEARIRKSVKLDFTAATQSSRGMVANLEEVIDWINLSPRLTALVSPPTTTTLRPSIRIFPPMLPSFSRLRSPLIPLYFLPKAIIAIANWKIPFLDGTAPKDLSATIQQLDTRLSQVLSWPSQYALIRDTVSDSAHTMDRRSLAIGRAHYIQFYNTMWLIANDVIIGSAFTSFICENSDFVGKRLGQILHDTTLTSVRELLLWLNNWPGGVKLNFELASLICDAFLWGTGLWEEYIFTPVLPYLPSLVYLLGLSGLLGTTMFLSFAADLLSLLTLHIYIFYLMATFVFSWHLSMLGALFNIFRGKKFNILRNRVEPAVYDVDQLLLGTILFTLAAFLFPTVLVYYLAFASTRLVIVFLHASMETFLAFMNHFPLFACMLRFKDAERLPGGLQVELCIPQSNGVGEENGVPYLKMKNNALHLAGIFFAHLQLSRRLASHYSPVYLLGQLLTGQTISPIPRTRLTYSSSSLSIAVTPAPS